ncbi:MAG: GntR family transcriptional regulator [Acidobacteria bacterium]|jgi:DNA-binding GntR family transcriptional regulator|nr:GntR family transcriptional regulator [Acidobacteriota bacterium]
MHNIDESPPHRQRETPGQLRQWAADRLRVEILEGRVPPGQWLRQEKLARELGVSQTPVREALKQLAAEGIVEHVPYRGIRVVSFSPEDVEDLYTSRICSEGRAARFAAQQIEKRVLDELRELHRRMQACVTPHELTAYRELNRQFHLAIIHASRRPYLVRSLTQLWTAFPTMLWGIIPGVASTSAPGRDDPDTAEHEEIIAALAARDPVRSERAMQRHIESAAKALVSAMRAGR